MIGIRGESEKGHIRDITFEDIMIGDEKLVSLTQMQINEFVHNVTIRWARPHQSRNLQCFR